MPRPPAGRPLAGFPFDPPLPVELTTNYYAGDRIVCLLCGRAFRSVGHHIVRAHGMSVDEYQDRYGLSRARGLVAEATRDAFAASIKSTIESGKLDKHFQQTAASASEAGLLGAKAKREIRRGGLRTLVAPPTPRGTLQKAIAMIEAGMTAATAVKRVGLSWSGFHGALKRHADLVHRYKSLPIRKGRNR